MKNKKIIFSFLSIFLVTACDNADTKTLSTFLIKNGNEWTIQIPNSWCAKKTTDTLDYSTIYNLKTKMYQPVSKTIDIETFDLLFNDIEDRKKINNDYWLRYNEGMQSKYYFKDKHHIYIYTCHSQVNSELFIAGSSSDYAVLGGNYLRVENAIYYDGKKIDGADVNTFRTKNEIRHDSEWDETIGLDKNYIYINDKPIKSREEFDKKFDDSCLFTDPALREQYFGDGK